MHHLTIFWDFDECVFFDETATECLVSDSLSKLKLSPLNSLYTNNPNELQSQIPKTEQCFFIKHGPIALSENWN